MADVEVLEYAWLIWDAVAAVIIVASIYLCAKRGLVRTVISFLAYFISVFAARAFSPAMAKALYDYVVKDALTLVVTRKMGETLVTGRDRIAQLLESFPKIVQQYLPLVDELDVDSYLAMEVDQLAEAVIDTALYDPVIFILQSLSFILIFSVVLFIIRHFSGIFGGLYRIPVIGTLDTFLGAVLGMLQAVVILVVSAVAARLIIHLTGNELPWMSDAVMGDTYIWRVFYNLLA
ncbi:CvpA family protein [Ruminococcaceae bacterium OttesenSCG-928-L11]|nr:CvpA family protein [Ruminococcaceae bacterium OttesenSCG-928-L11]